MNNKKMQQPRCLEDATRISRETISSLFAAFAGIYGERWARQHENEFAQLNAEKQWLIALRGFTVIEVAFGVERCRNEYSPYHPIPSIARFKFLAKNLIDSDKAYELAMNEDYRTPAIKTTVNKIGSNILKKMSADKAKAKFERVYGIICDDIIAGRFVGTNVLLKKIERNQTLDEYLPWVHNHFGKDAYEKSKIQIELYVDNKELYVKNAQEQGLMNYAISMIKN